MNLKKRREFFFVATVALIMGGILWLRPANSGKNNLPKSDLQFLTTVLGKAPEFKDTLLLKKYLHRQKIKSPVPTATTYLIAEKALIATTAANELARKNPKSTLLFENALAEAKRTENIPLIIWTGVEYAYYLYTYRDYRNASNLIASSTKLIEQYPEAAIIDPASTYKRLGYIFATIRNYNKSINYLEKAEKFTEKNDPLQADLEDNIGVNFLKLGRQQEAIKRFENALQLANKTNNTIRAAKIRGNLALIAISNRNYDEAIHLLSEDLKISAQRKDEKNTMYALTLLGKVYLLTSNPEMASQVLQKALRISESRIYYKSEQIEILTQLKSLASLQNQPMEELALFRKINRLEEEIRFTDGENQVSRLNDDLNKENYDLQLSISKEKQEKSKYIALFFGFLTLGLVLTVIMLIKLAKNNLLRTKALHEQKLLRLKLQQLTTEHKLKTSHNTIHEYKQYLLEKTEQIENLQKEIENFSSEEKFAEDKKSLEDLLQSHLMTQENWEAFKNAYQKDYPQDYEFILNTFPDLTDSNLRIVLLARLDLSNAEMANLLGVTVDAIKKAKQRLRKKHETRHRLLLSAEKPESF